MSTVSGGRRRAFRSRHHTPMGQGGKIAVIFVCAALLLFVFAVMLGNYLRGLAEDIIEDTTDGQTTEYGVYYANPPADMIARGIIFGAGRADSTDTSFEQTEAQTDSESSSAEDHIYEPDPIKYDAVSVSLRVKDTESGEMRLAYSSAISSAYSIDIVGSTELYAGIEGILSDFGERTRICGIFRIDYLNCPRETADIIRAYEAALICELVDAGFDEILLLGFSDNTEEGLAFISDIYEQKGRSTAIGMGLDFDFITSSDADEKLGAIAQKCGFLALDLSSETVPALMQPEALISDRVSRTGSRCREYSIRILVGCGDSPDGDSQTRAALSAGSKNIMTALGIG